MGLFLKTGVFLFLFFLAPGPAAPAETFPGPGESTVLRWADLRAAVDRHPALGRASAALEGARARVALERALPNPELAARGGPADPRIGGEGRREWELELQFPLDWLASRAPRMAAARAAVEAAQAEREVLRREVLQQLRHLFWNVAADQSRLEGLRRAEEQMARLVQLVGLRVEKGEARPIEKPRVEIEWVRLQDEVARLSEEASARKDTLALWLAPPPPGPWRVEGDLARPPTFPPLERAQEAIDAAHPRLRAALARVQAAREEVRAERSRRFPLLGAGLFRESALDATVAGLSLTASIPVWNRRKGELARARAEQAFQEQRAEEERRELQGAVLEAHALCRAGRETARTFTEEILPRAQEADRLLELTFQLGETTLLDVLDARRTLLQVHQEHQRALLEWHLDCSRLAALTGDIDHEN